MRIYSMTATFGKLENKTLTLEPGLNVIHAPNEWGKSTWCAFLVAMLYGIDTKERTTPTHLADKDRYAPWSGAAMAGRIDLCWQGKDITIERSSNQRVPLGNFRAYETQTGIDIPELNGNNCGQLLLGVERNVFVRAGFLRFSDLPVTQDEALRRRLNNLVTTGDESDNGDKLRESLKNLKNKCRSNRANGLIPEAEGEYETLKQQLWELQELTDKNQTLEQQRKDLTQQVADLENHKAALAYEAAKEDAQKVAAAKESVRAAEDRVTALEEAVKDRPSLEDAQAACKEAAQLQSQQDLLLREHQQLPQKPVAPTAPACFVDLTPEEAMAAAEKDLEHLKSLENNKKSNLWLGLLSLTSGLVAVFWAMIYGKIGLVMAITGVAMMIVGGIVVLLDVRNSKKNAAELEQTRSRYPGMAPETWLPTAQKYASDTASYLQAQEAYTTQTEDYAARQEAHRQWLEAFAGEQTLAECRRYFENAADLWQELNQARQELEQAQTLAQTLEAMVKTVPAPERPDTLTYSPRETDFTLAKAKLELQQTGEAIAQNNGRMDAIGHPGVLRTKLEQTSQRIKRLETYYAAIEMAQDALYKATLALQRRFSPRITKRTQELFSKLTGGRYQRITLGEDMGLETASTEEVTLRELRRRSDGTVDQLYLALRLAVSQELTPQTPLVLDDVLVRFDESRMALALDLLTQQAEQKQVILFTCQAREQEYLSGKNQ